MTRVRPGPAGASSLGRVIRGAVLAPTAAATFAFSHGALAQDASALLSRAAQSARTLNYTGTIVYQGGLTVETSRLVHVNDGGDEQEKLVNLDGPAREVIRQSGEVRCYYPDSKLVRIEPRTFRNAFPSISPQQLASLTQYYVVKRGEPGRIAGREAQGWQFTPRDNLRYGHEFWTDPSTGMLLKARTLNERGEVVQQFAFIELTVGAKLDRDAAKPTWEIAPSDWQVKQTKMGGPTDIVDTGWQVGKVPPGFVKIVEGRRNVRERFDLLQIVYSDGLVSISVFIDTRRSAPHQLGRAQQGGLNQFSVKKDEYVITALGEAPAETVRMIATSVARR